MKLIIMAKFIINLFRRILIRTNKTLNLHTIKSAKIYQTHLQDNKISIKTTNTGTLQGRYQRVMDVARLDILKEIATAKKN